jgi:hypothetical protein
MLYCIAMKTKIFFLISVLSVFVFSHEAKSQDKKLVTGIVTIAHKFPLNNVKVISSKTKEIAFTDSLGRFSLNCNEKDVISVSASGFDSRKVKVGKQNTIVVDLNFEDNPANFNSAVGGGYISENELQQAIKSIQLKNQKDYSKYNSIFELISCEIYDVTVKGSSVVNKAIRSMNSNPQVLYVVDEKIVSDIGYVNPTYVKSIEFVDGVAATMYGSMGANGVLKIYLK